MQRFPRSGAGCRPRSPRIMRRRPRRPGGKNALLFRSQRSAWGQQGLTAPPACRPPGRPRQALLLSATSPPRTTAGTRRRGMLGNQAVKTLLAAALCAGALWPCATPAIPEGPAYPSAEWLQREAQNYAKVAEAPAEQLNPAFLQRTLTQGLTNTLALVQRDTLDPSWLLASSTPLDQILAAIQNPAALSATLMQVTQQVQQNPASIASISLDSPFTPPCETYSLICA